VADASEFQSAPVSLREAPQAISLLRLARLLVRHCWLALSVLSTLLLLCLFYCLLTPNQYEAHARVAMRQHSDPISSTSEAPAATSLLSAPLQQETLVQELRSEHLAWSVIEELKLYEAPGIRGSFGHRFPNFRVETPGAEAREWLLKRFEHQLKVRSVAHTLLLEVSFRCRDAALAAAVVNALLRIRDQEQIAQRRSDSASNLHGLNVQLETLKKQMEADQQNLLAFENAHGILSSGNGTPDAGGPRTSDTAGEARSAELMELSRSLAAATSERILAEAAWRAASTGDPEAVTQYAGNGKDAEHDSDSTLLLQIRQRRSVLQEEAAQLSAEHGANFPRVSEIARQMEDLDRQRKAEDARLTEGLRSAWERARRREEEARITLQARIAQSMTSNKATSEHMRLLEQHNASEQLWLRLKSRAEEAGVLSGLNSSSLTLVDAARVPAHPVSPNPPLLIAIALFIGLWAALGAVYLAEALRPALVALLLLCAAGWSIAQAPTPSTSGLPSGVSHPIFLESSGTAPRTQETPSEAQTAPPLAGPATLAVPTAIGPGDMIEVQEFRTPEFHAILRVAADGTVTPPMLSAVKLDGLNEQQAAQAIEAALSAQAILLHPHVTVLVRASAGQDISVLGEVAHPGIYPYTAHHRLLDLISAASGLSPTAGRLVDISHRDDPHTAHTVVLDASASDPEGEHNPELLPGDTVQVSHAGLVYVIGEVVRPGGFAVDPARGLTVVQALSLAWGPGQNAATTHAVLIHEQKGGRTMTPLNLKRMLRGKDPDLSVRDHDILFVPDSTAKNLWKRSLEAAIQSAVGVTIYAGLVYSQRF